MRSGNIANEYRVTPEINAQRAHPDAIALRERLLAELGVASTLVDA